MQKTDEWLEKYNQETAALQTQLDKLKSSRATDLATYQRIAADVSEIKLKPLYSFYTMFVFLCWV